MSRSILDIAVEVCDRCGVKSPQTLFNTNDTAARRLRTAAKDTIRDMMRVAMSQGLSGFAAEWVFATRPGIYSYSMPPDLYRMVPGTEQRDSWPIGIIGPVGPEAWSRWLYGVGVQTIPMGWRIKNGLIHFEPVPTAAELVVIEYRSFFPVVRDARASDLESVNGRLTPVAPKVPREGYVAPDGWDQVNVSNGSLWGEAEWGTAVWGETVEGALRRIPASENGADDSRYPAYQVRAPEFSADDDRTALGPNDHVLSLGMTWRYKRAIGMSYAVEQDEYEREKDVFLANDASKGRTIYFGNDNCGPEVFPMGNSRWMLS